MRVPHEDLPATLHGQEGRYALILDAAATGVCLRYAFLTQGETEPILPELILDDWGHGIYGMEMYRWVDKHGLMFPRAEIFGVTVEGRRVQAFVRELEPVSRLRCYAYFDSIAPLPAGRRIEIVLIPENGLTAPRRAAKPMGLSWPLRQAQLSWWAVSPDLLEEFSLDCLDELAEGR
jgi:hypothetical protein